MRAHAISLSALTLATGFVFADGQTASFESKVQPVFNKSCAPCHNDRLASGGLNIAPFTSSASITTHREEWERILHKVRTGEMPPKGMPRPAAEQMQAITKFVEEKWEQADRNVAPDPGRVTARRLNRNEYSNTIRDLLDVDFRADKDFPTDDSGYGFDNIGDVLTISPVLMEKYISSAERIAARAIGADPLPKKPLDCGVSRRPRICCGVWIFQHHRSDAPRGFGRRVHHPLRLARRARGGCQAGATGDSGWTAKSWMRSWWKPSHPNSSTSIRTRKKSFASTCPKAIMSSGRRSSTTIS